jgi:hypothetical protein
MPVHTRPPRKNQSVKRTAAWRREVHLEAVSALERVRKRDSAWRARRDAERARRLKLASWLDKRGVS